MGGGRRVDKEHVGEVQVGVVEGGDMATIVIGDTEPRAIRDGGISQRENEWCGVGNG